MVANQAKSPMQAICSICLDNLIAVDERTQAEKPLIVWKSCGHIFHAACVRLNYGALPRTDPIFFLPQEHLRPVRDCAICPICRSTSCAQHCGGRRCNPIFRAYVTSAEPSEDPKDKKTLLFKVDGKTIDEMDLGVLAQKLAMDTMEMVNQLRGRDRDLVLFDRGGWFQVEGKSLEGMMKSLAGLLYDLKAERMRKGLEVNISDTAKAMTTLLSTLSTQTLINQDQTRLTNLKRDLLSTQAALDLSRAEHNGIITHMDDFRTKIQDEEKAKVETNLKIQEVRMDAREGRYNDLEEENQKFKQLDVRNKSLERSVMELNTSMRSLTAERNTLASKNSQYEREVKQASTDREKLEETIKQLRQENLRLSGEISGTGGNGVPLTGSNTASIAAADESAR